MKLCKDCRWHLNEGSDRDTAICTSPMPRADPVNGGPLYAHCSIQRRAKWYEAQAMGTCGDAGQFWEPRP